MHSVRLLSNLFFFTDVCCCFCVQHPHGSLVETALSIGRYLAEQDMVGNVGVDFVVSDVLPVFKGQ
jgi:hypothetical protein